MLGELSRWVDALAEERFNVRAWRSDTIGQLRLRRLKRRLARTVPCSPLHCRAFDVKQIQEELGTRGYAIVPNAFSSDFARAARNLILEFDELVYADMSLRFGRILDLEHLHPGFHSLVANPEIVAVAARMLGTDLRLSSSFAVTQHPHAETTFWHQDYPYTDLPTARPEWGTTASHDPVALMVLAMFDEFTERTGTRVVPGSHRRGMAPLDPKAEQADATTLMGPPGSIVFFDPRLWHTGQPNPTTVPRVGAFVQYRRWWLRPARPIRPISSATGLLKWLNSERKYVISDGTRPGLLHTNIAQTSWRVEHATPRVRRRWEERTREFITYLERVRTIFKGSEVQRQVSSLEESDLFQRAPKLPGHSGVTVV